MNDLLSGTSPDCLKISIVVRTQNRPRQLARSLQSLCDQNRRPDEVIVVNDAGAPVDHVIEDISGLNIRLVQLETCQGRARAGNLGVESARGNVIGFLDDDDRLLPDHLERLEQAMIQFDARVAYSGCRLIKRDLLGDSALVQERHIGEHNDPYDPSRLRYENYIPLINILIDRALWIEIGGFDESFDMFEDWDMLIRLSAVSRFYHLNRITTEYGIWGNGQITQTVGRASWAAAYEKILQKHILSLSETDKLKVLEDYWMVNQERRSRLSQSTQDHQQLEFYKGELARVRLELELSTADYQKKISDITGRNQKKISDIKEHNQIKISDITDRNQQQIEAVYKEHEQYLANLKADNEQLKENLNYLNALYELEVHSGWKVRKPPGTVSASDCLDPVHNLSSHEDFSTLKRNIQHAVFELYKVMHGISVSRRPFIRRYAEPLRIICTQMDKIVLKNENIFPVNICSCSGLETCGAATLIGRSFPDPRPVSEMNPTFVCMAGSDSTSEIMESDAQLDSIPFQLGKDAAFVFTTCCALNDFYRVDILLSACRRISSCNVRLIIREFGGIRPVRVACMNGLDILDNHCASFKFDPIPDSAQKMYRLEIDCPDAESSTAIAVLCHQKPMSLVSDKTSEAFMAARWMFALPVWMRDEFLSIPLISGLFSSDPEFAFIVQGITFETLETELHLYLSRLSKCVDLAGSSAVVSLVGEASPDVRDYCKRLNLTCQDSMDLMDLLTAVKQTGDTPFIWLCDVNAIPETDAVICAREHFDAASATGVIIPVEKRKSNVIRAAYGLMLRDGIIDNIATDAPLDHPYHGYRRKVLASITKLSVMRRTALAEVDLNALSIYRTHLYQMADLIRQLHSRNIETVYESGVCCFNASPLMMPDTESLAKDRSAFVNRWHDLLAEYPSAFSSIGQKLNPERVPTVLIIDATLPTYDEDSGSLRMYLLLKLWSEMRFRITFISDNLDSRCKYRRALETMGIEVFHGNYGIKDIFAHRQYNIAWVCRAEIAHRYIPIVRQFSPRAHIFYDTVDIHYLRLLRQAEIEKNPKLIAVGRTVKRLELSNCLLADKVITVTEDDGRFLKAELPNLEYAVLPNIHAAPPAENPGFEDRDGLVFIGNYNHPPNEDAVYCFIESVLPLIHEKLPGICFYVIGSHMKEKMKGMENDLIRMAGWVDQVEPEFAKRRVFVSFLRYGAGMKGKIGQALSLGLPVVTTSIGAEGMGLSHAETALIADDPVAFAGNVCNLYGNRALWEKLSLQGAKFIDSRYGKAAVQAKLLRILQSIQ